MDLCRSHGNATFMKTLRVLAAIPAELLSTTTPTPAQTPTGESDTSDRPALVSKEVMRHAKATSPAWQNFCRNGRW